MTSRSSVARVRPRSAPSWAVVAVTLSLASSAWAASPTWLRTVGGVALEDAADVDVTPDGGFVVVGSTTAYDPRGGEDYYVFRVSASGQVTWQAFADATNHDWAEGVRTMPDGGTIVVGRTCPWVSGQYGNAAWLLKLAADGSVEWQRSYQDAVAYGVRVAGDGRIVVAGGALVVELDALGNRLRELALVQPGQVSNWADLELARDGGLLLAGTRHPEGTSEGEQGWVVKLDVSWNVEWQREYGGSVSCDVRGVLELEDGGIALAGGWGDPFTAGPLVLRLDEVGAILWQVTFPTTYPSFGAFDEVHATCDGGLLAVGTADGNAWMVELDHDGRVLWQREVDGDSVHEVTASLVTQEGDVVAVGVEGENALFFRANRAGRLDVGCERSRPTDRPAEAGRVAAAPASGIVQAWSGVIEVPRTTLGSAALDVTLACEGPAELLPEDMPVEPGNLRVCCRADTVTLTFDAAARASAFNVHEGILGTWYEPRSTSCHLAAGRELAVRADGRLSYALSPGAGNAWFLVSSSSCVGESSLGRSSFTERDAPPSSWRCGAVP